MPVADKSRCGGNRDSRDKNDHDNEGRQKRQVKTESQEQGINHCGIHNPDHHGQKKQIQKSFDIGDDLKAVNEMVDDAHDFLRQSAG